MMAFCVTTALSAQHGSSEPGVASFLSAVNSIPAEIKALNAEKSVTANDFHLVSLQKITNEGNASVLSKALARNSAQIAALREALRVNQTVMGVLASGNVSIDQVVALDVQPGSEIHIFHQVSS